MNKRQFIAMTIATLFASACATKVNDAAARRLSLDDQADAALAKLTGQVPSSLELIRKAQGVLIFPSFKTAGLVIGGSWGDGVLRTGGETAGYYHADGASAGLLAGGDSKAVYVLFMTQEALDKFRNGNGWTFGVDASVVIANFGADASVDTRTAQRPVIAYVLANTGLILNVSLDGAKVRRMDVE